MSWLQVKEGEDYKWIRTDNSNQMRFIQERLAEECARQELDIDAHHMHEYEAAASGIGHPYVWDQVWGWRDTPLTYDQMRQRCPQQPFPICFCGPNVKPAEEAPEEDELERLHSIRHQTVMNNQQRPDPSTMLSMPVQWLQQPRRHQQRHQQRKHNHPQQTKHRRCSLQKGYHSQKSQYGIGGLRRSSLLRPVPCR